MVPNHPIDDLLSDEETLDFSVDVGQWDLLEQTTTPIALLEAGHFVRLSTAWEPLLGHTRAQLQGGNLLELVHQDDEQRVRVELSALRDGEPREVRMRLRTAERGWRTLLLTCSPLAAGGMVYVVASDVTDQPRPAPHSAVPPEPSRAQPATGRQGHPQDVGATDKVAIAISAALADPQCVAILAACRSESLSVPALTDRLALPAASLYRKIESLIALGFLEDLGKAVSHRGRRVHLYRSRVDVAKVHFEGSQVHISVRLRPYRDDDFGTVEEQSYRRDL